MRIIAAIQARLASTRLPEKVLIDLHGLPMLRQIARRLEASPGISEVVLATTTGGSDDALAEAASGWGMGVYRGPVDDLVARYLGTAEAFDADGVVRVWGDCPFVDPGAIGRAVRCFVDGDHLYTSTFRPPGRTFPLGLDVEIYRTSLLRDIISSSTDPFFREFPVEFVNAHITPERIGSVRHHEDASDLHLTVDYPEDLEVARSIYAALHKDSGHFDIDTMVSWIRANPEVLSQIEKLARNAEYRAKKVVHDRKGSSQGGH